MLNAIQQMKSFSRLNIFLSLGLAISNAKNVLGSQRKMLVSLSFLTTSHLQFITSTVDIVEQPRILHLLYDKTSTDKMENSLGKIIF